MRVATDSTSRPMVRTFSAPLPAAARVLAPHRSTNDPRCDPWFSGISAQASGRVGSVRWQHDGHWLYGALDIDEAAVGAGVGVSLDALAERAYTDVAATLDRTGWPHLLRLWNYLPHINADQDGMERYRRFNAGRQQALLHAGHAAFEGAPAASAVGTHAGPLCVRFIAGRTPALAIENPRQVSAYHYPSSFGPRSPSFSRAALVDAGEGCVGLFISGTASIVGHESVHVGDVAAQTRETIVNLRAVLNAAQARTTARFDLATLHYTVYVRHAEQWPLIHAELQAGAGAGANSAAAQNAVYLEADICRSDLEVEIEAHAISPGEVHA